VLIIPVSSTCFGQLFYPKHIELTGIINKPLLLNLFGCLYYLHQWCTVKQISDNKIYLLIKYAKSVLWRIAKRLSYIEDAWCLKVDIPAARTSANNLSPGDMTVKNADVLRKWFHINCACNKSSPFFFFFSYWRLLHLSAFFADPRIK